LQGLFRQPYSILTDQIPKPAPQCAIAFLDGKRDRVFPSTFIWGKRSAIGLDQCGGDRIGHENIAIAMGWWGWGGFI